jgi:hypothetical protein
MAAPDERTKLTGSVEVEQKERLLNAEDAARVLNKPDPTKLEGRLTLPLIFAVAAVTIGSSFQFGYHIGCVNAPGELITGWYRSSHFNLFNTTMTREEAQLQWCCSSRNRKVLTVT